MNIISKFIISILSIIIIASFFLPWVSIESNSANKISNLLTGEKQNFSNIRGVNIPKMANGDNARLIISLAKLFKPNIKNTDKKSYLVWAFPFLSLIILIITLGTIPKRWLNLLLGIITITISCVLIFKIKTTDLNKLVFQVEIGKGLWYTIYSYLGIGLLEILRYKLKITS